MPSYLHHTGWALALLAMAAQNTLPANSVPAEASDPASDEIELLMAEADALIQSLEALSLPQQDWDFLQSLSIRAGIGGSSNFLNSRTPVDSYYLQAEVDAYLGWARENTNISLLFFAEASVYDYDLDPAEEALAMLQLSGVHNRGVFDFGVQFSASISSLIADPSLDIASTGTGFEQWIPSLMVHADWYQSERNRLRLGLSMERTEFNIEGQDYWSPMATLEWERVWHSALRGTTTLEWERQVYDDDVAKLADGTFLPDPLRIERISVYEKLTWDPATWEWLTADLHVGMSWENEDVGRYETLRQSWIGTNLTIRNFWGQFRIRGRWTEYRYAHRYVDPDPWRPDTRPSLLTLRTLSFEYQRPLPWWNLTVLGRLKWKSMSSRITDDAYSDRRAELLLQWGY